jgi:hypothetical protein
MVLLRRTTEVPPLGRVGRAGIDLHLGQKPKLGGRYTDDSLIYISYFVGPMYIHVSFSLLFLFLFLLSKTQKDQKYFHCFSLLAFLVFYLWFALLPIFGLVFEKSKNILLCLLFPFVLVSKIENPKNICYSSSVLKSLLQSSVSRYSIGTWYSLHIIQATQVKSTNDDI